MTLVMWLVLFLSAGAVSEFAIGSRLAGKFPLSLMRGQAGDPRAVQFLRIVSSAVVMGTILGLLGGCVALALRLLIWH